MKNKFNVIYCPECKQIVCYPVFFILGSLVCEKCYPDGRSYTEYVFQERKRSNYE